MKIPALLLALACALPAPASAAIICLDQFQYSGGRWISTPFCQDGYLAYVAREHGARVSDWQIRENPEKKIRICQFVGFDVRAELPCAGYRYDHGNGLRSR
jgi:hypothetical protein